MISITTVKKSIYGAAIAFTAMVPVGANAAECTQGTPQEIAQCSVNLVGASDAPALTDQITLIINLLIGLIATAAVIMLIIGGFRYVFSQGEEKATKGAKDTILYAIIGIVVSILAFSITNFVIRSFK